ncbi:MAG: hypothetical protein NTX15_01535 [Candidatus Kapabacteria bacterium]|nr:hypothetical protein [Candidatus Kapabacteria bacterium]
MYLLACISTRSIAAIAFCALLLTRFPASAQEIVYDTVVRNTLGPELWAIPVSGPLTISEDGRKVLVASVRDSMFYIVDVATGAFRPLMSAPDYWGGAGKQTSHVTDASLTWLWVTVPRGGGKKDFYLIDVASDTIIRRFQDSALLGIASMSRTLDRCVDSRTLYRLSTMEPVSALADPAGGTSWFDDTHRKLYRNTPWQVDEIDPVTGKVEQTWAVNSEISYARRPANSDWLYVYNYCVDAFGGSCGDVNAINVVTQERVMFTKHMGEHLVGPSGYIANGATSSIGYASRWATGLGFQPIWSFDAVARTTAAILNPVFYFGGELSGKHIAIMPDFGRFVHGWQTLNRDSSFTRCNQIVPLTTTVDRSTDSATTAAWLEASGEWMEIRMGDTENITSVDLHTVTGQLVKHLDRTECLARPLRISLAMLQSGSYMCTVQTTQGTRSSSFTISK